MPTFQAILHWIFGPHFFDVGAILCIGIGFAMALSPDPKDISGAQWFFGIAALLAVGRAGHWLVTDPSPPLPKPLLAAFLFGSIGALWIVAHSWTERKLHTEAAATNVNAPPSAPRVEIGLALGAEKGIGIDSIVDCSKPPYRCLDENQIAGEILPLDVGAKGWARLIFRLKNVGMAKLSNPSVHVESPSAISIDYAPAPNPSRLPRNVLEVPSGGMDIQPFSISKGDYAVPIDVVVPSVVNDVEINVKVFGDNMSAHDLKVRFYVVRKTSSPTPPPRPHLHITKFEWTTPVDPGGHAEVKVLFENNGTAPTTKLAGLGRMQLYVAPEGSGEITDSRTDDRRTFEKQLLSNVPTISEEQINASDNEMPQGVDRSFIFKSLPWDQRAIDAFREKTALIYAAGFIFYSDNHSIHKPVRFCGYMAIDGNMKYCATGNDEP